jgi:NADPH2 dehydrogenase
MQMFTPYVNKELSLKNRIVMPPMCMYSADHTGKANRFHQTHYSTRAIGGVGLIIVEATGVCPNGRISERDLGLWNSEQMESLQLIVNEVHEYGSKIAIQLGHAGRKYVGKSYEPVAPSAIPFDEDSRMPIELSAEDIQKIILDFVHAATLAEEAGFDAVEIHGAHGYLIHEFLSPISNHRKDEYGGNLEGRAKFLLDILRGVRQVFPKEKPILLRISATDYHEDGIRAKDMVAIINLLKPYVDIVHVSSGGLINVPMQVYPGYQVRFAEWIKEVSCVDTIAVGKITSIDMIEEILGNKRSDLVAMGRELLRNPFFVLNAIKDQEEKEKLIPKPYIRGFL